MDNEKEILSMLSRNPNEFTIYFDLKMEFYPKCS
jgi:hypothetical protein